MSSLDRKILKEFKELLLKKIELHSLILFGSRARGDADRLSDMDVLVIVKRCDGESEDYVSDCAWEAGYPHGVVVVPVVFSRHEWREGPERHSLLAQAIRREGVAV